MEVLSECFQLKECILDPLNGVLCGAVHLVKVCLSLPIENAPMTLSDLESAKKHFDDCNRVISPILYL